MDLLTVLTNYLETHKRLVIPQLGSFLVKEPGKSVLFSALLKRDDGVLRGLLMAGGMSELEAHNCIDRFVYEVRNAFERGESYPLPGFGSLKQGPNGTIAFQPELAAEPVAAPAAAGTPAAAPQPAAAGPAPQSAPQPAEKPEAASASQPVAPAHIDTARMTERLRTAFELDRMPDADDPDGEPAARRTAARPAVAAAPRRKPAYTLEDAVPERKPAKRKVDRFMLIAIVAAVLAIAAIAFGFWREAQEQADDASFFAPTEQPADSQQ